MGPGFESQRDHGKPLKFSGAFLCAVEIIQRTKFHRPLKRSEVDKSQKKQPTSLRKMMEIQKTFCGLRFGLIE
jgi:hypothetical protein